MSHQKTDLNKSVNLTIDGMEVTVPEGTTILEAARKINVRIPTLCDYPGLGKRAVCRLCVVECDGRGKLVAACANEVWEGVKVVTNNLRILAIRKTIVELLLANHPQECLTCVRSGKCELQTLAITFGIRSSPFRHEAMEPAKNKPESETLIRDPRKCVKCGRCVEACQEVQTVRAINSSHRSCHYEISTPYKQALCDGPCIFCGRCAAVCPVGAIYEHDQTARVWELLKNKEKPVSVRLDPSTAKAFDVEFDLPPGTVTAGKIAGALKRLGFEKVFDVSIQENAAAAAVTRELLDRIKNKGQPGKTSGKLPLITGCLPGWAQFTENFYPDLAEHFPAADAESSKIEGVYISSSVTKKHEAHLYAEKNPGNAGTALTPRELALMIRLGGIELASLPESPFDQDNAATAEKNPAPDTVNVNFPTESEGIKETTLDFKGAAIKAISAIGYVNARKVLDSVRAGECDAEFVVIH